MNLPFDSLSCAEYIRALSPDILPAEIRCKQQELKVPSLGELGCRFIALCAALKSPRHIIDIGCGIGASTLALHMGAPRAEITAIDANLDRAATCKELTCHIDSISVHCALAVPFLEENKTLYDLAFVDSVKKDYPAIWYTLRKRLNPGATVIFDDILLHGYTAEPEATVPFKYRDGRRELRNFLQEMTQDSSLHSQIIPLDGGMLLVNLK